VVSDARDEQPAGPPLAPPAPHTCEQSPRLPPDLAREGAAWLRGKGVFVDTTTPCCARLAQLESLRDLLPRAGAVARSFLDTHDVHLVVTRRKPPPPERHGKEPPKPPCKPAAHAASRRAAQMLLAAGGRAAAPRAAPAAAAPADGRATLWDQAERRGLAVVRPADLIALLSSAPAKGPEPPAKWMVLKVAGTPPFDHYLTPKSDTD
jgi:hypothetical protein